MQDIVIVGASGFGREIVSWLWDCFSKEEYRLKGFLGKDKGDLERLSLDVPVLDDPERYDPAPADRFLLAVGNMEARRRLVETIRAKGGRFLTMIHPTALIQDSAQIGEGVVIYPYAIVSNNSVIGDYVFLCLYASIGHDATVGDYCYLSPYATLNGMSAVEEDVFMGTHSMVAPCQRVGRNSRISANSAVLHDVPPDSLVFGVPGKRAPRMDQA